MRHRIAKLLTVVAIAVTLPSTAMAYSYGVKAPLLKRGHRLGCDGHAAKGCGCFETMTITRTIYEPVTEQREKVVYDTVWDIQTVDDVRRVSRVEYHTEEFTYHKPVFQTVTREVPYTTQYPVTEMQSREVRYVTHVPSYETRVQSIPYTTYQCVQETHYRTVSYRVPRQVSYTKTIQIRGGHWETKMVSCPAPVQKGVSQKGASQKGACQKGACQKGESMRCIRVWVPCVEEREITCCKTVYDVQTEQRPYTVTRRIPQMHTREVPCTIVRMMPVTQSKTVHYPVTRMVSQQHFRTVNATIRRMVPETGLRTVPHTVFDEIPCTRTVKVPRQVPRTVCYTVTHSVPRTVTCEVRVPVCCPKQKCAPKGKCGGACDGKSNMMVPPGQDLQAPEMEVTPKPEMEVNVEQLFEPVNLLPVSAERPDSYSRNDNYEVGLRHYWNGEYAAAIREFQTATQTAPENAKYAYFYALALRQAGQLQDADRALAAAVELELITPIARWGKVMQRVQGTPRLWIEAARR